MGWKYADLDEESANSIEQELPERVRGNAEWFSVPNAEENSQQH